MPPDLRDRFLEFVRRKRLVTANERVLVALSGGVDSMVLLHLFRDCAAELGIEVSAAHFDHGMRPQSADDARFVAGVCSGWNVPFVAERAASIPRSEAEARDARYAFLMRAQQQTGAQRIATAHHADDQVETVLFRLLRGAGLRGLSGIPVRRGVIVRPLLRFRKRELTAYAARHAIAFREDETNVSGRFARNRIRHVLVPALHAIDRKLPGKILRLARHAAAAERAWRKRAGEARTRAILLRKSEVVELASGVLREYDAETRARVLRSELRRFGIVPDRAATGRILDFVETAASGSRLDVGGGVRIERAYDVVRITRAQPLLAAQTVAIPSCADGAAQARIGDRTWRVTWTKSPGTNAAGQRFACAGLTFPLVVRGWRPGDRMRLVYGTKKLKKLFAEARIPVHARAAVPVLVDANGRICWVVGVARSGLVPAPDEGPALTIVMIHDENS
jgi:tRNA(Ile)-lysidine synthase